MNGSTYGLRLKAAHSTHLDWGGQNTRISFRAAQMLVWCLIGVFELGRTLKNRIHVCALRDLSRTLAASRAGYLVSAIEATEFPIRPQGIPPNRHLKLDMDDITLVRPAMILPSERHVSKLLDFAIKWDQNSPLVIHCFAGASRSTACAYIALCALNPDVEEIRIAEAMRRLCRRATPNRRLVALADDLLGRDGRMVIAAGVMNARVKKFVRPFAIGESDFTGAKRRRVEFLNSAFPFWAANFRRDLRHSP